jgi:hypothetical protein
VSFPASNRHFTAWCRFHRSLLISALGIVSSVGLSFSVQIAVFSADRRFQSWVSFPLLGVDFRGSVSFSVSALGVVSGGGSRFQF